MALSGETEFVVVGSLAIVGAHPLAPAVLRVSQDIDLFFLKGATLERNRAIYERFGPDSEFSELHDFYIEPVGVAPEGLSMMGLSKIGSNVLWMLARETWPKSILFQKRPAHGR